MVLAYKQYLINKVGLKVMSIVLQTAVYDCKIGPKYAQVKRQHYNGTN